MKTALSSATLIASLMLARYQSASQDCRPDFDQRKVPDEDSDRLLVSLSAMQRLLSDGLTLELV